MKRETLCPVYFFRWQQPDVNRSHQLRQRTLQDKGNDQQTSFVVRNCSVVIFYLIQCLPLSLFFSWLLRQKERLCNPESFWTPLSKKTKVKIQWFSANELNLNWLNYSIWKNRRLCVFSSLCVFSLQLSMGSQRVLANLPELSFLSANSSRVFKLSLNTFYDLFLVFVITHTEPFLFVDWCHALFVPQGAPGKLGALTLSRWWHSLWRRYVDFDVFRPSVRQSS